MTDNYRKITDIELGSQVERERIINLIEALGKTTGCYCSEAVTTDILELIKGENATDFTSSALPNAQEGENK